MKIISHFLGRKKKFQPALANFLKDKLEQRKNNDFQSEHWRDDQFRPILIDFRKSEEISKVEGYKRGTSNCIEPEVILREKESPSRDIYLFGKCARQRFLVEDFVLRLKK